MRRRATAHDPSEALLRRTRLRIATVTLLTVTALVVAVGVTSALAATALMRQGIDRALDHAVADELTLHELFEDEDRIGPLGEADTFVMLATRDGQLIGSSTDAQLAGLPDRAAIDAAAAGDDRRDGLYGETPVRLLTTVLEGAVVEDDDEELPSGPLYVQAGFNLTLQNRLEQQLVLGIAMVGLLGIVGAVVVTLVITDRALAPIRDAFATERRFVAAASHELQTPTSIIRASAEILEREHLVGADGAALVDDIIGETDRMGRLVGDLLALASLEAGAISVDVEELDLGTWFEAIARRARSITESHGLRFASATSAGEFDLAIESDRDRLDQIVLILVDNAINHSPPDGEVALDLRVDARAGTATAEVRDEGPGIPPQELERIFEPFARGGTRRRSPSGAGLGLAIARQLTGRLGVELAVAGMPGAGAVFRLTMPLSRAARPAKPSG
jgi:signal transduction histidine kinase